MSALGNEQPPPYAPPPAYNDMSKMPYPAGPPMPQPGPPMLQPGYTPMQQPGYPPMTQPGYPPMTQPGYPPMPQPVYPPMAHPGPPLGPGAYPPAPGPPPGPGAYPPAPPGPAPVTVQVTTGTGVTVTQGPFRDAPVSMKCPHCQATIVTAIEYESGTCTWLSCLGLCLIGCDGGCCLIPFCMDSTKDMRHICPSCNHTVGASTRI